MSDKFFSVEEIKQKLNIPNNKNFVNVFFNWQVSNWQFAKDNYTALKSIKTKRFDFSGTSVIVQYNPHRIGSALALIDDESIANRKCFLCDENLHAEQTGIKLTSNYTLLVNPFPIISQHFTAKFNTHLPQKISENFIEILLGAKTLGNLYFLLYNGPEAGASVPEHRHFQGGAKNCFPIVSNLIQAIAGMTGSNYAPVINQINELNNAKVFSVQDELRNYFVITGTNITAIEKLFFRLFDILTKLFPSNKETKLNLISAVERETHYLIVFPRAKHRPSFYYKKNEERLIVSPATLDFGGIIVLPREEDFNKISKQNIKDIFSEVGVNGNDFKQIISDMKKL